MTDDRNDDELDELHKRAQAKIQALREGVNESVDRFGDLVIASKLNDDRALMFLTLAVTQMDVSREELAALFAFAIRRLWHKRASAHISMN